MYKNLINILFPRMCLYCSKTLIQEEPFLCFNCTHDLPVTKLHSVDAKMIKDLFYGSAVIQNATALFYYHPNGIVQELIHHLKYKGQEGIGSYLGLWLGNELVGNHNYKDIDYVLPVPLHPNKLRKRGYNQVDAFGKEIAKCLKTNYDNSFLVKEKNTSSQTLMNRFRRWSNVAAIYKLNNKDLLTGKHILLVDDIITTGATLKACLEELNTIEGIKLSIAVMAYTE